MEGAEDDIGTPCNLDPTPPDQAGQRGNGPKILRKPTLPSKEEQAAHSALHVPFASWCRFCVANRAKDLPHRKQHYEGEREVPLVQLDFSFPKMLPTEKAVPCLVVYYVQKSAGMAMQLQTKRGTDSDSEVFARNGPA